MKIDELRRMSLGFSEPDSLQPSHQQMIQAVRSQGVDPAVLYQELEMSAPYINTHRDTSLGANTVSLHSHAFGELIYCREADKVEYLVGSQRYRLQSGDIIYVPPGVSHCPILSETAEKPYVRDVIWLSNDFIQRLADAFGADAHIKQERLEPLRTVGTWWEFMGELFARGVREEMAGLPGWETLVTANTLMIITYLNRIYAEHSEGKIRAEKPELLDRITAYIEENYAQRITAAELARKFYVSSSSISHLFKQKMGISVYHYITRRRLIAAKSRIESGESLENVALAVGFTDYSGFYRAFKQEYGISPRQYRKHYQGGVG